MAATKEEYNALLKEVFKMMTIMDYSENAGQEPAEYLDNLISKVCNKIVAFDKQYDSGIWK